MLRKSEHIIPKEIASKILMIGVYYKNNAPGGMAAVIQYYEKYFECLRYFPTWKPTNLIVKTYYLIFSYLKLFLILFFDKKIKLLHIHTAADNSFWRKMLFVRLGKQFKKKIILHVHASRFKEFYSNSKNKKKILENLRSVDCLVVLSESWRKWFIEIGIEKNNVEILNNITEYPSLKHREAYDNKDQKIHFLFLGELGERKGIFDLLRVLINYKHQIGEKIELRIGGNTNEERLLKLIKENDLESFIKFEGWVSGEKKIELLNWADIYILPSYNEGLPIGILEAMSYGCTIISTPVGGIPDVITTNLNGTLVTPGNDIEIVNAIKKYLINPSLINKEGEAGKKIVKDYLPDFVLNKLKYIYLKMLQ